MLNILGRLHQSPAAQLAQELKSIPVDWAVGLPTAIGTNSPCNESPAYLTTLLDAVRLLLLLLKSINAYPSTSHNGQALQS